MQGAAGAVESLGRALGPVWGNAVLQRFGETMPYLSAAACLALTLVLSLTYRVTDSYVRARQARVGRALR